MMFNKMVFLIVIFILNLTTLLIAEGAENLSDANKLHYQNEYDKAFEIYLRLAEEEKNPRAMYTVGLYYLEGLGSLEIDESKSLSWLQLAKKNGNKQARTVILKNFIESEDAVNQEQLNILLNEIEKLKSKKDYHRKELISLMKKKNEFETSEEHLIRVKLLLNEYRTKRYKINISIENIFEEFYSINEKFTKKEKVKLEIEKISDYNYEEEKFDIKINGLTKSLYIDIRQAELLKKNINSIVVYANMFKSSMNSKELYNNIDFKDPLTNKYYNFSAFEEDNKSLVKCLQTINKVYKKNNQSIDLIEKTTVKDLNLSLKVGYKISFATNNDFKSTFNALVIGIDIGKFGIYINKIVDDFNINTEISSILESAIVLPPEYITSKEDELKPLSQDYLFSGDITLGVKYEIKNNFGIYLSYVKGGNFEMKVKEIELKDSKDKIRAILVPEIKNDISNGIDVGMTYKFREFKKFGVEGKIGFNTVFKNVSLGFMFDLK